MRPDDNLVDVVLLLLRYDCAQQLPLQLDEAFAFEVRHRRLARACRFRCLRVAIQHLAQDEELASVKAELSLGKLNQISGFDGAAVAPVAKDAPGEPEAARVQHAHAHARADDIDEARCKVFVPWRCHDLLQVLPEERVLVEAVVIVQALAIELVVRFVSRLGARVCVGPFHIIMTTAKALLVPVS
eukprot:scaffold146_cov265-Pinguiococcus_pyrenoidosus.AAC.32